jgi:hypothetical protein
LYVFVCFVDPAFLSNLFAVESIAPFIYLDPS